MNASFEEHMRLHLAILGPRDKYHLTAMKYKTVKVGEEFKLKKDGPPINEWLTQQEIIPFVKQKNIEGYTCWISLHDKEEGKDLITGVKALCDFWIDIDTIRSDKTVKATKEQLQEALNGAVKLQSYIEKEFGAHGFMAKSGNGFHIHFPLPRSELPEESSRKQINKKIREFAKQISLKAGVEGDHTYDIRRVTTLIGSLNLKIPESPLQTKWSKSNFVNGLDGAINLVNAARPQNKGLLEAIFNTEIQKTEIVVTSAVTNLSLSIEKLCKKYPKFNSVYNGDFEKYFDADRSRAEAYLLVTFIINGFSDLQIYEAMVNSKVGKWHERCQDYKENSLENAHEYVIENKIPIKTQKEGEEPSENIIEVCQLIREDFIAEQIYDYPNFPQFAVKYFDRDEIEFHDTLDLGEIDEEDKPIIYHPIMNDHIRKGTVILPRKPVKCTVSEIVKEAFAFVKRNFDACGKDSELKIQIIVVIAGWFIEKEKPLIPVAGTGVFAPIIPCRGGSGSGKNRLANCLRFCSYHPLIQLSTFRIPSIYRPLDYWKGTLVIDECDVKDSGETAQLTHFLNSRATGTPILRQNPESPSKCDAFDSFGITICTQRKQFDDNATEGRSIPFYCDKSEDKKITTMLTIEEIKKGFDLQDKLLYMRLMLWDKIFIDKKIWVLGVSDHRLNSTLLPAMALAKFDPQLEEIILSNVANLYRQQTLSKSTSDDGLTIGFIWDKIESDLWYIHNGTYYVGNEKVNIYDSNQEIIDSYIQPLTTKLMEDALGSNAIKARSLRKIFSSLRLGPENKRPSIKLKGKTFKPIFFTPAKLEKKLREFVVDYEDNSLYKKLGIPTLDMIKKKKKKPEKIITTFIEEPKSTDPSETKPPTIIPQKLETLKEKLKVTLKIIKDEDKRSGAIKRKTLLEILKDYYNISEKEADKLVYQLLKEGAIFSPMSGYLKGV